MNGGNHRPCATCLLVGFVYTDTGEVLTDGDAITVMRQSMNRMITKISHLQNTKDSTPWRGMSDRVHPHNERGPHGSKIAGD